MLNNLFESLYDIPLHYEEKYTEKINCSYIILGLKGKPNKENINKYKNGYITREKPHRIIIELDHKNLDFKLKICNYVFFKPVKGKKVKSEKPSDKRNSFKEKQKQAKNLPWKSKYRIKNKLSCKTNKKGERYIITRNSKKNKKFYTIKNSEEKLKKQFYLALKIEIEDILSNDDYNNYSENNDLNYKVSKKITEGIMKRIENFSGV